MNNQKYGTIGIGPAIASADAMFRSDVNGLVAIRDEIGWASLSASASEFALGVLSRYGARGNAKALQYVLDAGSEHLLRKLRQECVDGEFNADIAYKYGIGFLRTGIIDPLKGESLNFETSLSLRRPEEEPELIAALSAMNQFIVLFEISIALKSGRSGVTEESLLTEYRNRLVAAELAGYVSRTDQP